jgi:deoxyadenosine kinase
MRMVVSDMLGCQSNLRAGGDNGGRASACAAASASVRPICHRPRVQTDPATLDSITPPPVPAIADGSGPTPAPVRPQPADVFGNIFIGIAGMIGAGKSTLAAALGQHLGIETYYEPVADNEYLADFYRDTERHSFAMQVYLLNRRFQQHQEIIWRGRSAVQDRTIYEDSIFAKMLATTGLMDERDYRTYVQLFRNMSNFMCKPSVIVYLDVSPEASADRIASRSRDVESKIELGYLRALHAGYSEFVENISKVIPVIRVDYERFATAEEMAEVIKREYLDISFLRNVTRFDPTR